jgi:hypothetical protein
MVRIQGMKRDVTPGFATALGAAGGAVQGAVGMRGELQRQDAQAQEMALQAEQAQMQRVEFGLATEKLRLGIEEARSNMERDKKLRADQRVANTASLRAMQRSGGYDALGPEVRAFHEEAIRLASEMEPEAGARVVAASGAMIAKADNDVRRSSMLRTVMGSVSTGYWKQAESVLAEIAGIDLDGDGTEDVSSRKLSDIAEEWTKRLQDPTTDASEIEQEYRQLRRAVDGAIARQEQRLKVYNVLQTQFEEAFSPPPLVGNSAYQSAPMPEGLVAEAKALLEDWRIGELGDGPGAEAEAKRSMRALINGNKFLPLPDGSPYGDGIELPWAAWDGMQDRERANLMGVLTGNDVRLRALDMASDHVSKLLSTKTVDPEDAPELLAYYANWYSSALSGAPLPAPPKAAAQQSAATTPDAMLEDLRSNGTLDKLRQSMGGRSEDEKFQLLSAFIDSQSEDESVRSGLAQKLIMELMP